MGLPSKNPQCRRRTRIAFRHCVAFLIVSLVSGTTPLAAQDAPQVLADGLLYPSGIAIQPISEQLFLSETGKGRILCVTEQGLQEVVAGFSQADEACKITDGQGPLGIVFLDKSALFVGEGGEPENQDLLRLFEIEGKQGTPLSAQQPDAQGRFPDKKHQDRAQGLGDLYSIVRTPAAIYVTSNGGLGRWSVRKEKLGAFQPWGELEKDPDLTQAFCRAIAMSPDGAIVVGMLDVETSWLVFLDSVTGRVRAKFELDLKEIRGLGYSPQTGELFAIEYSAEGPAGAGLYRLQSKAYNTICESELVMSLPRPTAMLFDPNGSLYVTVAGQPSEEADPPNGQLLKISNWLAPPTQPSETE